MEYIQIVLGAIMGIFAIFKESFNVKKYFYLTIMILFAITISAIGIYQEVLSKKEIAKKREISQKEIDYACLQIYYGIMGYDMDKKRMDENKAYLLAANTVFCGGKMLNEMMSYYSEYINPNNYEDITKLTRLTQIQGCIKDSTYKNEIIGILRKISNVP